MELPTQDESSNQRAYDAEIIESSERLHRFFVTAFTAADIAVPLPVFDAATPEPALADLMRQNHYHLAGLLGHSGRVIEVVAIAADSTLVRQPTSQHATVNSDTPLVKIVELLDSTPALLVTAFGAPSGYIIPACMHKPPARMWLFGILTLLELRASIAVERLYGHDSWRDLISPARLAKAEELHAERTRIGQPCLLVDCLQISDKSDILARTPASTEVFGMSRRQFKNSMQSMLALRNSLAHAQDFIPQQWPIVVMLARTLDERLLDPKLPQLLNQV
jgi:hypothetical protein